MSDYSGLKPELLKYCEVLMKKHPKQKDQIIKVLDYLKWMKKDKYFECPPIDWLVEYCEQDSVCFHNLLFFVEVKQKKDGFYILVESSYFGRPDDEPLQLPLDIDRCVVEEWVSDNVFYAINTAFEIIYELDETVKSAQEMAQG